MAACSESLRVDREKLDPSFDGYKLSLDPLPVYNVSTESGVDEVKLHENQYSLQHVKAFGIRNYLVTDQWNPHCVFYVDDQWKVKQMRVVLETQLDSPKSVFQIPATNHKSASNRHFVSFHFPGPHWSVLADGAGTLYILETNNRDEATPPEWKIAFSEAVCGSERPFVVLDSTVHTADSKCTMDCLLIYIEEAKPDSSNEPQSPKSNFTSVIEWVTITRQTDTEQFQVERKRKLQSKAAPQYVALEPSGEAVYIAADSDYEMIEDSVKPVKVKETTKNKYQKDTVYSWTQSVDDVTVTFILPEGVGKADIDYKLTSKDINLGIKNLVMLLKGELFNSVDVEASTWTIENRKFELTLSKSESGPFWSEVVRGDKRGEYVTDSDQAAEMYERLSHLTSDQLSVGNDEMKPAYNSQELEECDAFPEDTSAMTRIDGNEHKITNKVSLGSNQWLFNVAIEPGKAPATCLRHDVDGLIWQPDKPDSGGSPWKHIATFNALGYVQASKRDRKFASCAPDFSYAALCDCSRHVYVYRQCIPTQTPLRNRKTGKIIGQVAKQQLVTLETNDSILGFQTSNERLYILTREKIYVVRIPKA
ncbi:nudC domain-containing protein 1-like [Ptychodera flava]|uniref:nudC domain-containing protein 1-like n=1 Tax=Ptychodera flava TaxID=63121 RepID=UPI003969F4AC